MTASLDLAAVHTHPAVTALWDYLREVTDALGVGLESCTVDHDTPVSAYVALDQRLPLHPDRDVALVWDEVHGWAAAVETHSGEDLIVLRYLGGKEIVPPPGRVAAFAAALLREDYRAGQVTPPRIRAAQGLSELGEVLQARRR